MLPKPIIKLLALATFMSDDGVGIRVIEEIRKRNLFNDYDNVILIEGGTLN